MEKISSADYKERAKAFEKSIEINRQDGNYDAAAILETQLKRFDTHRRIEAATGLQFDVVKGLDANVAAFVDTESSMNGITESTLDNQEFALHAAHHENEHRLNGMFKLPLELLDQEDHSVLCDEIGEKKLDETALIEGFNELSTFRKHSANENSGYAAKEVPLAEKLEKLAQEYLKISLLDIFRSGNAEKFVISLQQLAIKLRLQEVLAEPLALAA